MNAPDALRGNAFEGVSCISDIRALGIEPLAHESLLIGYLAEAERKTVDGLIWFAGKYPVVFCSRKSAVVAYAVLERSDERDFEKYVEFLRNFEAGGDHSKRMAWKIVSLLSKRKGLGTEIPEEYASLDASNNEGPISNPVLAPEVAKVVKTASDKAEVAVSGIAPSEKRLSEALQKRLWRRYRHLQSEFVVRGSGETFDEKELSKELFGFMQAHISGNRATMSIPRFEDMGASLEDSTKGLSLFFLLLRKYADAGYPLSTVRRWLEQKKAERFDAEGLSYAKFFLRAVDEADMRKGVESAKVRDAREELQYLRSVLVGTVKRMDEIIAQLGIEE